MKIEYEDVKAKIDNGVLALDPTPDSELIHYTLAHLFESVRRDFCSWSRRLFEMDSETDLRLLAELHKIEARNLERAAKANGYRNHRNNKRGAQ